MHSRLKDDIVSTLCKVICDNLKTCLIFISPSFFAVWGDGDDGDGQISAKREKNEFEKCLAFAELDSDTKYYHIHYWKSLIHLFLHHLAGH